LQPFIYRNEPIVFPLNQVIPGWTEALQLLQEGAKWQIVILPKLADAEQGPGRALVVRVRVGADPVQPEQRLSQSGVLQVSLGVDREEVVAEERLGGTGLDPAQVDAAARELLEDLKQSAGVIGVHVGDQRGLVGPRGLRRVRARRGLTDVSNRTQ